MFYANSSLHAFLLVPLNKTHMQESLASSFILEWQEILGLEKLTSKSKCIFLEESKSIIELHIKMFSTQVEIGIKRMSNILTRVIHVLGEPIVFMNNGSEPTSSVILPTSFTKSLCGLAVVHI